MPLTPEQKQMVEENIGLAHHAYHEYSKKLYWLDPEEILSACYIGLIKSVIGYDPSRGKAVFATYAMKVMFRTIQNELIPRKKQVIAISLEEMKSPDSETFWQDVVADGEPVEDIVIHDVLNKQIMEALETTKMNETHRKVIKICLSDPFLTQREIGKIAGCNQVAVCRALEKAREQLRPMICIG